MTVVVVVVALVVLAVIVTVTIVVAVFRRFNRRADAFWSAFDHEATDKGETVEIAREPGVYRGGSGTFSSVKGNAHIALTDQRLVIRRVTGLVIEVRRTDITGARTAKVFRGSVVGGQVHVVVSTTASTEVAFFAKDPDRWVDTING